MYNMHMHKHILIAGIVIILIAVGVFAISYDRAIAPTNDEQVNSEGVEPVPNPSQENAGGDRMMDIATYVSLNISTLSPEAAVLGGTFYVTEIRTEDGVGYVKYEDGHNAYVADFTYTTNETSGHVITSFTVRK
jgi:hypothetical protein